MEKQQTEKQQKASLKEVLSYGKPYSHRYFFGVITILCVDMLEMVPPATVALAIDSLRGEDTKGWFPYLIRTLFGNHILALSLVIVCTLGLQWILRYIWRVCFIFTREYIARDLRQAYFHKLTTLPDSFYSKSQTGELMSLATNDIDAVRMMMGPGALMFVDSICYFMFVGILLFSWHFTLTLYLFLLVPFLPFMVKYFSYQIHIRYELTQAQLALISSHAQETFSGISVVKNFVREEKDIERFSEECKRYVEYQISLARIQSVFWPLMGFIVGIEALIVLIVGGSAVQSGDLTTGEFVGFFLALWLLTWPTVAVAWVINMYQKGTTSLGRISKVLKSELLEEEKDLIRAEIQGDIVFENISFTYPGRTNPSLDIVSFHLQEGKTLAIVGALGCGKTTLLKLLLKFYLPQEGKIRIGSYTLKDLSPASLRKYMGYVPQEGFLFSASILENISLGMEVSKEEIEWAAKMASIHDEILEFPAGYGTLLGEKGVNLSGGQKQRISIARALVRRPAYLILDDCLSSVDTQTEEKVLSNLQAVRKNSTAIISTHRLTAIKDADLILVFEKGKILQQGSHDELMGINGWYSKTYSDQLLERELESEEQ